MDIHFVFTFNLELLLINDELMFKIWIGLKEGLAILLLSLGYVVILGLLVLSVNSR